MVFVMPIFQALLTAHTGVYQRQRNIWQCFFKFKIIIQLLVYSLRAESAFLPGTLDFHKLISDHVLAMDQQGWGKSLLCNSKATLFK